MSDVEPDGTAATNDANTHSEESMPDPASRPEPPCPVSPWVSGLFYLFAFAVIAGVFAAVGKLLTPWALPVIIAGTILTLSVVGALQLKQDSGLTERSFLTLMGKAIRNLPLLGKLGETPDRER
jgi:hypothetical protein